MAASGMLLLIFIALFIYAVMESLTKWKTALQILATVGAFLAIACAMSLFIGTAAAGTLAGALLPLVGVFASWIVIRRDKKAKQAIAVERNEV
jgi:predicted branched-subunit amino acid permease